MNTFYFGRCLIELSLAKQVDHEKFKYRYHRKRLFTLHNFVELERTNKRNETNHGRRKYDGNSMFFVPLFSFLWHWHIPKALINKFDK